MTYLTRPVFLFPVNWADPVNKGFLFDLREASVGFGADVFTSLEAYVVQGWSCKLMLQDSAAVQAADDFFNALGGNLKGFWFPALMESMQIVAVTSTTVFEIGYVGLAEQWAERPDIHLWITPDYVSGGQAARIQSVENLGNGRERVTMASALSTLPTVNMMVARLHYVRLAGNDERGTFIAEGVQEREIKVVELPHEYAAVETGEQPLYLYRFWTSPPHGQEWGFTSFAADVVSNGLRFKQWPMTHGDLTESLKPENAATRITAAFDAAHPLTSHPFNLYMPLPPSKPLNLQILKAPLDAPDASEPIFTGRVRVVNDGGKTFDAQCDAWASVLRRKTPRMIIQSACNYTVFDLDLPHGVKCCGLERNRYETTLQVTALDGFSVECSLFFPAALQAPKWKTDDWFARGFIEYGAGLSYQARSVVSSTWDSGSSRLTIKLNAIPHGLAVGSLLEIIPGCDGEAATCRTKFENFDNFGGFVDIPARNPALQAMDMSSSQGGKK